MSKSFCAEENFFSIPDRTHILRNKKLNRNKIEEKKNDDFVHIFFSLVQYNYHTHTHTHTRFVEKKKNCTGRDLILKEIE